jgi:hypothetical protein
MDVETSSVFHIDVMKWPNTGQDGGRFLPPAAAIGAAGVGAFVAINAEIGDG